MHLCLVQKFRNFHFSGVSYFPHLLFYQLRRISSSCPAFVVMPRNIEIKARVRSLSKVRQLASELASKESSDEDVCTVIKQRDVFYHASSGRLKLRFLFDGRPSQLVAYQRSDQVRTS